MDTYIVKTPFRDSLLKHGWYIKDFSLKKDEKVETEVLKTTEISFKIPTVEKYGGNFGEIQESLKMVENGQNRRISQTRDVIRKSTKAEVMAGLKQHGWYVVNETRFDETTSSFVAVEKTSDIAKGTVDMTTDTKTINKTGDANNIGELNDRTINSKIDDLTVNSKVNDTTKLIKTSTASIDMPTGKTMVDTQKAINIYIKTSKEVFNNTNGRTTMEIPTNTTLVQNHINTENMTEKAGKFVVNKHIATDITEAAINMKTSSSNTRTSVLTGLLNHDWQIIDKALFNKAISQCRAMKKLQANSASPKPTATSTLVSSVQADAHSSASIQPTTTLL